MADNPKKTGDGADDGETLIEICDRCDFCIFERILKPEDRKRKVLDIPVPKGVHIHRRLIEDMCDHDMDLPCDMKYAAMRVFMRPYSAAQYACANDLIWDLGKRSTDELSNLLGKRATPDTLTVDDAFDVWAAENDKGRGFKESYAERFREIWDLGVRTPTDGNEEKQILSTRDLYETIVSEAKTYEMALEFYSAKKIESERRSMVGIFK